MATDTDKRAKQVNDPCLCCRLAHCDDQHPGCAYSFPDTYRQFVNKKKPVKKGRSIIKISLGRTRSERKANFKKSNNE